MLVATTVNVAASPAVTVWLVGCTLITGAGGSTVAPLAATVRVTGTLVAVPAALVTVTV
jgi:hypothetical protein